MNRLLLLALPIALAGCSKPVAESAPASPQAPTTASASAPSSTATATPIATMSAADAKGPITRYHWQLTDAKDAKGSRIDALFVRDAWPLRLDFRQSHLTVGNTCNDLVGRYAQAGNRLTVAPLASTLKACNDETLGKLDQAARSRLQGALGFVLDAGSKPALTLTNATGDRLVFAGEPIPEVRYGGPGKRIFLEVAAETKPCNHPRIPGKQCLQVRDVKYDAKGVKVGTPGKFLHFYGDIDGFTHVAGVRNVLRIDRYKVKDPPPDGASTAYVLDSIIETENVGGKAR